MLNGFMPNIFGRRCNDFVLRSLMLCENTARYWNLTLWKESHTCVAKKIGNLW